eukprot:g1602.t1
MTSRKSNHSIWSVSSMDESRGNRILRRANELRSYGRTEGNLQFQSSFQKEVEAPKRLSPEEMMMLRFEQEKEQFKNQILRQQMEEQHRHVMRQELNSFDAKSAYPLQTPYAITVGRKQVSSGISTTQPFPLQGMNLSIVRMGGNGNEMGERKKKNKGVSTAPPQEQEGMKQQKSTPTSPLQSRSRPQTSHYRRKRRNSGNSDQMKSARPHTANMRGHVSHMRPHTAIQGLRSSAPKTEKFTQKRPLSSPAVRYFGKRRTSSGTSRQEDAKNFLSASRVVTAVLDDDITDEQFSKLVLRMNSSNRLKLINKLVETIRQIYGLLDITPFVTSDVQKINRTIGKITSLACGNTNASGAILRRLDEDAQAGSKGCFESLEQEAMWNAAWKNGSGLVDYVVETRAVVNTNNPLDDKRFAYEYEEQKKDFISNNTATLVPKNMLCAPIFNSTNQVIGVLQIMNKQREDSFSRCDEAVARNLAGLAGLILRNKGKDAGCQTDVNYKNFEDMRTKHALSRAVLALQAPLRMDDITKIATNEVSRLIGALASRTYILLRESSAKKFVVMSPRSKGQPAIRISQTSNLPGVVLAHGCPINVYQRPKKWKSSDERDYMKAMIEKIERFEKVANPVLHENNELSVINSAITIPFKDSHEKLIGFIHCTNRKDGTEFSTFHLNLLEQFARHLGRAIERALKFIKAGKEFMKVRAALQTEALEQTNATKRQKSLFDSLKLINGINDIRDLSTTCVSQIATCVAADFCAMYFTGLRCEYLSQKEKYRYIERLSKDQKPSNGRSNENDSKEITKDAPSQNESKGKVDTDSFLTVGAVYGGVKRLTVVPDDESVASKVIKLGKPLLFLREKDWKNHHDWTRERKNNEEESKRGSDDVKKAVDDASLEETENEDESDGMVRNLDKYIKYQQEKKHRTRSGMSLADSVWADNHRTDVDWNTVSSEPILSLVTTRAIIGIPIHENSTCVGAFVIAQQVDADITLPRLFGEREIMWIQQFADTIGKSIERCTAIKKLETRLEASLQREVNMRAKLTQVGLDVKCSPEETLEGHLLTNARTLSGAAKADMYLLHDFLTKRLMKEKVESLYLGEQSQDKEEPLSTDTDGDSESEESSQTRRWIHSMVSTEKSNDSDMDNTISNHSALGDVSPINDFYEVDEDLETYPVASCYTINKVYNPLSDKLVQENNTMSAFRRKDAEEILHSKQAIFSDEKGGVSMVPLFDNNKNVFGVIQLQAPAEKSLCQRSLQSLAVASCRSLSSDIQTSKMSWEKSEELKKARSLLQSVWMTLTESRLIPLLWKVANEACALLCADRCSVFLIDETAGQLWSKVATGLAKDGSQEIRIALDEGIAGWVAMRGKMQNVANAYEDVRFNPSFDSKIGYKTLGVVQLINKMKSKVEKRDRDQQTQTETSKQEAQSHWEIFSDSRSNQAYEVFTREDEDLLRFYCKILAHAIQNAQLYESEIQAREQLATEAEQERREFIRRASIQEEMISTLTQSQS